jgi:hypothetical protein
MAYQGIQQDLHKWSHSSTDRKTIACADRLWNHFGETASWSAHVHGRYEIGVIHDNEDSRYNNTDNGIIKYGVGNDRQRLIDNHVCKKQSNKKKMAILANGFDLVRVYLLLPICSCVSNENKVYGTVLTVYRLCSEH